MNCRKTAFRFINFSLTCCLLHLVASATNCPAAPPNGVAPTANANEVAEFNGTLKGFQNGVLQIDRDGTAVMVQPPKNMSMFNFVATAKLPFLQRGMLVRYDGSFHQNGIAASPIDKVTIFQPFNMSGVPGHGKEPFTPGVHPHDRHAKKGVGIARCKIVGNLIGIGGDGTIMVQAGKIRVAAKLSEAAVFEIRFNNLSLAQPGDPVSVAGFYNPPDDTKIRGDRVTITTDRIYGEPTEKKPPVRRTRRSRTKPKTDAAESTDAEGEAEKAAEPNATKEE